MGIRHVERRNYPQTQTCFESNSAVAAAWTVEFSTAGHNSVCREKIIFGQ